MALQAADRTPEGWSGVADAYEALVVPFTQAYARDALDQAGVQPGEHVLDVACGPGTLALEAARRGARVTATDFAPAMVDLLRRRLQAEAVPNVTPLVMDGQHLDLADASFDAAFSIFGLIFFPDRARGFTELRRVLRPEGRAVVAAWSRVDRVEFFQVLQQAARTAAPDLPPPAEPPAILSLSDPDRFQREMDAAGFRSVRIERATHAWTWPSPQAFWDHQQRISPMFQALLERLGPARVPAFHEGVIEALQRRTGGGPVVLQGEALLGIGHA
jgi:SAM-dependent methyltransferase